ncbi:M48 family metallopeptidase [Roseovarius nanhaiticus]|uniref:Peptidase family M48 n=1 Tax=Roseovarius nanhaiticus TaxID=573024 RepID=A0A1N7FZJ4_9RHOB|nr:M48 family metallopeptidase [Roseovarius nanhaiticus]SEK41024.1 Peptidase family M48 [Roseovarius nanhaiticus]SIS05772.1 Peptidase family M48 [Roseovarius nanhaiticus]
MRKLTLLCVLALAACDAPAPTSGRAPGQATAAAPSKPPATPTSAKIAQFKSVVAAVEPVAERECNARTSNINCDFRIVVDDRPGQPANAFQTVDKQGRPILAFNLALIAEVRNRDELAFVMGHEAAHHIAGHLDRQRSNAMTGAILLGGLAAITGAGQSTVQSATDIGAGLGARTYSKDYELEADALGTVITRRAGYNPVRGAEFFTQIADPGDRFLGTHPPNAQRIETVRRVDAGL